MNKGIIAVVIIVFIFFSCESSRFTNDCGKCYPDSIGNVNLSITVKDFKYDITNPVLTVYEGLVTDSIIIYQCTIGNSNTNILCSAELYKTYSATLEFLIGNQKYITVDETCPKMGYDETTCDQPCYFLYDNTLDLRLRYSE